jgi:hypothetical protein
MSMQAVLPLAVGRAMHAGQAPEQTFWAKLLCHGKGV